MVLVSLHSDFSFLSYKHRNELQKGQNFLKLFQFYDYNVKDIKKKLDVFYVRTRSNFRR